MIKLTLTQWEAICDRMEHDKNLHCPLVTSTCEWLRGLVSDFAAMGRDVMEIYEGGEDYRHIRKYCEEDR